MQAVRSLILMFWLVVACVAANASFAWADMVANTSTVCSPIIEVDDMTLDEARDLWSELRIDHPLWNWQCQYQVKTATREVTEIRPGVSEHVTRDAESAFDRKAGDVVRAASGLSEAGKCLYFHDWLCANVDYDYDFCPDNADQWPTTAASAVLDGNAVCSGYARAFCWMARHSGMECLVVVDGNAEHAWNKVKVDGVWTNVDVTLDDGLNGAVRGCTGFSDSAYAIVSGYTDTSGIMGASVPIPDSAWLSTFSSFNVKAQMATSITPNFPTKWVTSESNG